MAVSCLLLTGLTGLTVTGLAATGPASAAPTGTGSATVRPADMTQGLRLLMVDLAGCAFCARWKAEVLPVYADRPEGRAAPLGIVPIAGPWPDGLALAGRPRVTPTFILLADGLELARIEGYDGAGSFWAALGRMLGAVQHPVRGASDDR